MSGIESVMPALPGCCNAEMAKKPGLKGGHVDFGALFTGVFQGKLGRGVSGATMASGGQGLMDLNIEGIEKVWAAQLANPMSMWGGGKAGSKTFGSGLNLLFELDLQRNLIELQKQVAEEMPLLGEEPAGACCICQSMVGESALSAITHEEASDSESDGP